MNKSSPRSPRIVLSHIPRCLSFPSISSSIITTRFFPFPGGPSASYSVLLQQHQITSAGKGSPQSAREARAVQTSSAATGAAVVHRREHRFVLVVLRSGLASRSSPDDPVAVWHLAAAAAVDRATVPLEHAAAASDGGSAGMSYVTTVFRPQCLDQHGNAP